MKTTQTKQLPISMNKELALYRRNKNIFLENIDNSFFVKALNLIVMKASPFLARNCNVIFSERIIEYPILFRHLGKTSEKCRILDFGCVEDLLPIHLASLGYRVTGIDFRPYPFSHKNFDFIQGDILVWDPPTELFDKVISISTIEHVGLSGYGDPVSKDGDKIAVKKLLHSLKRGGELILTVPAGKACIEGGMRIYDGASIRVLVPNIELLHYYYKPSRNADWIETTEEVISTLHYENYRITSPAQGVAFVTARKP